MPSLATDYVIHGPRSYVDYDKPAGNRKAALSEMQTQTGRQLLVSDQTANILSNFLAVFLAISAKSLYHVMRRLLRVVTQHYASTDPTTAPSAGAASHVGIPSGTQGPHQRQVQRLETIDGSYDTETMIMTTFRRVFSQLRSIVPIRPLGDNAATRYRILTAKFWHDTCKLANESSGDLLWHFIVGLGALVLYFGALLLGIMSAYPVVGDSVAVSQHPHCGVVISNMSEGGAWDVPDVALKQKYFNDIARESRQYAKSCYGLGSGESGARSPDSCSFFYETRVKYSVTDNDTCPFRTAAGHLCLGGEKSA
jgi:hypothetical protein